MDFYGITSLAAVTVICALAAQVVKGTKLDSKWLPVICGALGGVLGVAGSFVIPDFPAFDPLTAVAVGIVSGLAATGAHQVFKQLSGGKSETEEKQE